MNTPRGNENYQPHPPAGQGGHLPHGQPPYNRHPHGQPQYGQQPYASPAYASPANGQPPYGQRPYAPPRHSRRRVPGQAGDLRRCLAVGIDFCLAWFIPWLLLDGYDGYAAKTDGPDRALVALGCVLATSFLNQVVLTLLFRASVGKLIAGIRVIRAADGGHPRFWRTVRRWLSGLCWVPLQPWYWLRSLYREIFGRGEARGTVRDNDDGELYDADLTGLRCARRKDLQRA